ncbi:hypothetical protein [Neobacillus drentensis]|uniref:hypothetical protein n=1 Tax=Neobacillus drentensis TaxID=220684 RepID=UPI00285A8EDA|nr:hypothetical protein [Neobacillus drentensis]MDR7239982.1 hypothetical protein [Neobacillus drentensis]
MDQTEVKTMSNHEKMTQVELLEILTDSYIKGQEEETIKVMDLIEEIKQRVMLVMEKIE